MSIERPKQAVLFGVGTLIIFFLFLLATAVHFFWNTGGVDPGTLLSIRLSIYLQEVAIAGILAMGGLCLQTLLSNPLAEPFVLGVSSGAGFGAMLASLLGFSPLLAFRTLGGLAGAVLVTVLVALIAGAGGGFSIQRALLAGVAFNAIFSSLIMLAQSLLAPNDLRVAIGFLMGTIDAASWRDILIVGLATLPIGGFILVFGKDLDVFGTGDEMALAVGVDTRRLKFWGFAAVSVSAGVAVSVCGMIGFLGLVAPHAMRMLFGRGHRRLLAPTVLFAAALLVLAGALSRHLVQGTTLPAGVITSLAGAPFFIYLLLTRFRSD